MQNSMGLIARLLLGSMALGWLVAPLHFVTSEHLWCVEHAQVEHGDNHHKSGESIGCTHSPIPAGPDAALISATDLKSSYYSKSHTACQVLGNIDQQKVLPSTTSVASVYSPMQDAPLIPSLKAFHRPEPLLSIAPKHSPPQMVPSHTA